MTEIITAQTWFALGERVRYDYQSKRVLGPDERTDSGTILSVFHRTVPRGLTAEGHDWTTFLPGFPDGSYGWSRVDAHLGLEPRLYIEYVGQGDSDKPRAYRYGTGERADLVERTSYRRTRANHAHREGSCSSTAACSPTPTPTRWLTTPLLKTPIGKTGTWLAQRSRFAFDRMLKGLLSREYGVTSDELAELYDAITRRDGAAFMSMAAGFVDEHKANADRWDLRRAVVESGGSVSFHVVGTEDDPFEPNQIVRARERLREFSLDIRVLPGGHMATSEQPEALAEIIQELAPPSRVRLGGGSKHHQVVP